MVQMVSTVMTVNTHVVPTAHGLGLSITVAERWFSCVWTALVLIQLSINFAARLRSIVLDQHCSTKCGVRFLRLRPVQIDPQDTSGKKKKKKKHEQIYTQYRNF